VVGLGVGAPAGGVGTVATPGRFRTRALTSGVTPSLHVDYKYTAIKQYHKEGRALRTETTINDTRDFGIGKRLHNLPACGRSASPPTGACSASNDSATTRSASPRRSPPSTTRCSPRPAPASPGCGSPTAAPKRCCRSCSSSGSCPTDSPTATYANSARPLLPESHDQPQDDHRGRFPDHGEEQEPVIVERDAPLIRRFVADSIRVCGRVLEQLGQPSIDEVTDVLGQVAVLLSAISSQTGR